MNKKQNRAVSLYCTTVVAPSGIGKADEPVPYSPNIAGNNALKTVFFFSARITNALISISSWLLNSSFLAHLILSSRVHCCWEGGQLCGCQHPGKGSSSPKEAVLHFLHSPKKAVLRCLNWAFWPALKHVFFICQSPLLFTDKDDYTDLFRILRYLRNYFLLLQ